MRAVFDLVRRVAAASTTVCIRGESGTGKELVAHAIHDLSERRSRPFISVNCAALPETLMEAELFGYEKGAFTGATETKEGRIELAHRGTLFLDEIGELPFMTQAKLLRVLEEKRFERIGGTQAVEADTRILCATNKNLEAAVAARTFREDLYFRIAAVPLTIPPLRERGNDVLLLAAHFLERFARELSKPGLRLSDGARESLLAYHWPGNIRELQNTIERAVILVDGAAIEAKDLRLPAPRPAEGELPEGMLPADFSWDGTLQEVSGRAAAHVERAKIAAVLRACKWNKTRAAEQLGVSYKTLLNKIRDLAIPD
jgi:transcriptional regulator with PAS, ATPase and Fis domain